MEEWRDIEGYEGIYQVSNEGRVKSLPRTWICGCGSRRGKTETILKPIDNGQHLQVKFYKEGTYRFFQIHRLVADAFLPNPNGYNVVHHIDHNPRNNIVENLVWIESEGHNKLHNIDRANAIVNKLSKTVLQYTLDGKLVNEWKNAYEASRQLGYNTSCIRHCCYGGYIDNRTNKWHAANVYKGFIWKYA